MPLSTFKRLVQKERGRNRGLPSAVRFLTGATGGKLWPTTSWCTGIDWRRNGSGHPKKSFLSLCFQGRSRLITTGTGYAIHCPFAAHLLCNWSMSVGRDGHGRQMPSNPCTRRPRQSLHNSTHSQTGFARCRIPAHSTFRNCLLSLMGNQPSLWLR